MRQPETHKIEQKTVKVFQQ